MICVIPARAGSKRVPNKNILRLENKPLIAHSVSVARDTGLFENIYVCTEDYEIADIARTYGAVVPIMMPSELCGDLVPSHIPCQYMADHVGEKDSIICLQPTSPLRSREDIMGAVEEYGQ